MEIRGGGHTVYLITFYAGEGTCETAFAYTDVEGKLSGLPEATREEYDFGGWYTPSGEKVTIETVYTQDTVLEARWVYNPVYTITVTGSGTGSQLKGSSSLTMPDGTTVTEAGVYRMKGGNTIVCKAVMSLSSPQSPTIKLNGTVVGTETYDYVVRSDATIELGKAYVTITES